MEKNTLKKAEILEDYISRLDDIEEEFKAKDSHRSYSGYSSIHFSLQFNHYDKYDIFKSPFDSKAPFINLPLELNNDILCIIKKWKEKYEKELEAL